MTRSESIVVRARGMIGVRFRPQGRNVASGLDCVGLVAAAAGVDEVPVGYPLRGGSPERLAAELRAVGFRPRRNLRAGDVLVLRAGVEQLHLGIWSGDGLVHADATLRRVVERPGPLPWPVLGIWRISPRRAAWQR